mmetsp:Transcript_82996/g.238554  ORF Transcript_82996/g.238554 Transcript_82996/m.238554 type:complete len:528 (-) Transcript_82996:29-1612(-)
MAAVAAQASSQRGAALAAPSLGSRSRQASRLRAGGLAAFCWSLAAAAPVGTGSQPLGGFGGVSGVADVPWDAPGMPMRQAGGGGGMAAAGSPGQSFGLQAQQQQQEQQLGPLVIGGIEFSREDDIENMEKLSELFGRVFYTSVLYPGDASVDAAWQSLSADIWALAEHAVQVPALALSVAMCLYNYFWWEGPHSLEPRMDSGWKAAQLMHIALGHAGCRDRSLPPMEYYIRQCHLRWRYLFMLAGEVGRHLVLNRRDIAAGAKAMAQQRTFFEEFKGLPNSGLLHGMVPHEVNFNGDYYPASVARQGPVWKNKEDLPIALFLEANYPTIKAELEAMVGGEEAVFRSLDEQTRNAETQFGPRGDDWLTAYMFRKGEAIEAVCARAPRTCALLRTRPEIANCKAGGSGAGFLRMSPGGRLKPHFGNAPRLSVHLGLIVPDGEIRMQVGYETVRWEEGKTVIFDDTFIHQVVHNGEKPRYVMNLWMCHPCDPDDGKAPGEVPPAYCEGPPGAMHQLGLQPLPPRQQQVPS